MNKINILLIILIIILLILNKNNINKFSIGNPDLLDCNTTIIPNIYSTENTCNDVQAWTGNCNNYYVYNLVTLVHPKK